MVLQKLFVILKWRLEPIHYGEHLAQYLRAIHTKRLTCGPWQSGCTKDDPACYTHRSQRNPSNDRTAAYDGHKKWRNLAVPIPRIGAVAIVESAGRPVSIPCETVSSR